MEFVSQSPGPHWSEHLGRLLLWTLGLTCKIKNLKCTYSNNDQLLNKMTELEMLATEIKPDIMSRTQQQDDWVPDIKL